MIFFNTSQVVLMCLTLSCVPYSTITLQAIISKTDHKEINRDLLYAKGHKGSQVSTIMGKCRFWGNYLCFTQFHISILSLFLFLYTKHFEICQGLCFSTPYKLGEYRPYPSTQSLLRVKRNAENNRTECINWGCPGLIQIRHPSHHR